MGILVRISMKVSMGVSRGSPHNKQKAAPELLQTFLRASLELFTGKSLWDAPRSPCGSPKNFHGDSHWTSNEVFMQLPMGVLMRVCMKVSVGIAMGVFIGISFNMQKAASELLQSFPRGFPELTKSFPRGIY